MKIKSWERFQHYKKGDNATNPQWIKVYRRLLEDREWHELDPLAAKTLISLWLLASENGGVLPPLKDICFRLRMPEKQVKSVLSMLPHWIEDDPRTILEQSYDDPRLEEEREEEKKEKKNERGAKRATTIPSDWMPKLETISLLQTKGHSEHHLERELEKFRDHHISRGTPFKDIDAGFRVWVARSVDFSARGQGPPPKEKHFRATVQEFLDEVDEKHGNSRRAIRGPDSGSNVVELHAATPRLENHVGAGDANPSGASKIDAVEDG